MLCCRAWESCACSARKAQRVGEEELVCWELWSRCSHVASYCAQAAFLAAVERPKLQSPQEDRLVQHPWVVRRSWRRAARQREASEHPREVDAVVWLWLVGSVRPPQHSQQLQRQAHKGEMDRDAFWVKHSASCELRCYQVGRDISAVTTLAVSHLVAAVSQGGMCDLEHARLGHHLLAGWVQVLGAAPVQGQAGGAGVGAVAQDGGFPAAEAPGGGLSPQPGPGAAPAAQAACCVLQQVPTEEHVNPGVAAAAEAGQQHGDGESHVGGLWQGKGES